MEILRPYVGRKASMHIGGIGHVFFLEDRKWLEEFIHRIAGIDSPFEYTKKELSELPRITRVRKEREYRWISDALKAPESKSEVEAMYEQGCSASQAARVYFTRHMQQRRVIPFLRVTEKRQVQELFGKHFHGKEQLYGGYDRFKVAIYANAMGFHAFWDLREAVRHANTSVYFNREYVYSIESSYPEKIANDIMKMIEMQKPI